jgi:CDP-glucose 4,6-dehydratase
MTVFDCYRNSRVLVTGHTGFKGSWLCAWLLKVGARVAGYSLDIPTTPSHFQTLELEKLLDHYTGDVRNRRQLENCVGQFRPDILFHLAAQPIVRESYREPALTFETNLMGTVNVLESIRSCDSIKAAVLITSDKCYRNVEWEWGYRENDALGGHDPYSASKGCAELAIRSYGQSFFEKGPAIASTRAGNVIGGGDWAADRIVPDAVKAWSQGTAVTLRNPMATRPWQHVLEPLGGYLLLGSRLLADNNDGIAGEAFNFGPDARVNQPVESLIRAIAACWEPAAAKLVAGEQDGAGKESTLLKLCCDKALHRLGWHAVLSFEETARLTAEWYNAYYGVGTTAAAVRTNEQIDAYMVKLTEEGIA